MERSDERLTTRDLASGADDRADGGVAPDEPARDAPRPGESADAPQGAVVTDVPPDDQPTAEPADASQGAVETDVPPADEPAAEPAEAEPASAAEAKREPERDEPAQLLPDSGELQARWEQVQVRFVDEPRGAVEDADALVATVMKSLAEGFAQERERLEAQWGRGEDISTEDLRVALQRYRSFFQRLLST